MPIIKLTTEIKAPIEICFNLSRSIDLHKLSTAASHEEAISGVTKGLIGPNEEVTWEATHFGIRQRLTSRITAFELPTYFRDEMVKGAFKMITHDHRFEEKERITFMKDTFEFEVPLGVLGQVFNKLILTGYLKELLIKRNLVIKEYAESTKWNNIIQNQ